MSCNSCAARLEKVLSAVPGVAGAAVNFALATARVEAEGGIGGALAAAVLCDAVIRLLPGALGDSQSAVEESFSDPNLMEAPCYTRPVDFMGMKVPEVLLSGNHAKIEAWRGDKALERTRQNRPDLQS
jgi:tRNA (guanine-N1)-methyltransferase